jgi:hypothetical protein
MNKDEMGTYSNEKEKGVDTFGDSTGGLRAKENSRVRYSYVQSADRSN